MPKERTTTPHSQFSLGKRTKLLASCTPERTRSVLPIAASSRRRRRWPRGTLALTFLWSRSVTTQMRWPVPTATLPRRRRLSPIAASTAETTFLQAQTATRWATARALPVTPSTSSTAHTSTWWNVAACAFGWCVLGRRGCGCRCRCRWRRARLLAGRSSASGLLLRLSLAPSWCSTIATSKVELWRSTRSRCRSLLASRRFGA